MASSSRPSTKNMTIHESNFTNSNATMNISTQSSEPSTNSINIQGNFTKSNVNVQISTGSMPREPPQSYGLLDLPKIVDKREDDIRELHALMTIHRKVVITGIAGLGKTTLANLCARKWVEDGTYQHVLFINVETDESASGVFKRLAEIVLNSQVYSDSTIKEIYERYNTKKTLLILDNIEQNSSLLSRYYPSVDLKNIDILGTSQFTELERLFHQYPLQVLSKEASFNLVMNIFKHNDIKEHSTVDIDPVIYDLVDKLESHPLALQHAAAHIINMCTYDDMPLEQSLNKYNEDFKTQLKQDFPADHLSEYRKSVYAAISLNIKKATIEKEHVKLLLHCMTYLDPAGINIVIFYKAFSTKLIQESLKLLKRYSLISVDGDKVSMHRLVPRVCHAMLTANDKVIYLNRLFNIFFYNEDYFTYMPSLISRQCFFFIEHFEMNFNIDKKELAAYYKAAFHNNHQIKERLTARLQMIDCVISDAEGWSVLQCCVFAGHMTFYDYFNGMGYMPIQPYEVDMFEVGFIQVIKNSSTYIHMFKHYNYNEKKINKPIFKGRTMLSICAAFGIYDYEFNKLIDMGCDVNIKDDNGMTPLLWALKSMSYDIVFTLLRHGAKEERLWWGGKRNTKLLSAAANGDGETVLRLLQTSKDNYATAKYGKTLLWWAAGEGHHDIVRELIERGTDTSGTNTRGNTLLHMIASRGYDETISQFIHAAGDVNIANSNHNTALMLAAIHGHEEIISQFITANVNLNFANSNGDTALILAAWYGQDKVVSQLIKAKVNVNIANSDGETALIHAIDMANDKIVSQLIGAGANVNFVASDGETVLLHAIHRANDKIVSQLIGAGANVNFANSNGNTVLIYAAIYGHDKIVSQLIGAGANVNFANSDGNTALIYAIDKENDQILSQLIDAGADVNTANSDDNTALLYAIDKGNDKIVSQLIDAKSNVNFADSKGNTALICAIINGHDKIVSKLIDAEANVNIANSDGNTALIVATMYGHDEIVSQLINAGANVNIADSTSDTALIIAALHGHDKIVSKLIDAEANVNITDSDGNTALILAAGKGHDKITTQLAQADANVNIANNLGITPLYCAARNGHREISMHLIKKGASVNAVDGDGYTPLYCAARNGYREISMYLIEKGASVNAVDGDGYTPLYCAARNGYREISMYLIEKGASVNAVDSNGYTPLYWAAKYGHRELVIKLVNRGAHVDTANKHGSTPLLLAAEYKHREISMYLIEKGASVNAVDGDGDTPLLFAAKYGDYELALELINRGARTDTPANNKGETPLSWAQRNKDDKICALFQIKEKE